MLKKAGLLWVLLVLTGWLGIGQIAAVPKIEVNVSSQSIKVGETIRLEVSSNRSFKKATAVFAGKKFVIFRKKAAKDRFFYYAFLGVPRYAKAGSYSLKVFLSGKDNKVISRKIEIQVAHTDFGVGKVKLKGKKKTLAKSKSQLRDEGRVLGKGFRKITPHQYFISPFKRPADGRISSGFGAMRSYTGKTPNRHSGVDIANKAGVLVRAPNRGKVILSRFFPIHGNTIMIDHGLGIISVYNHLSARLVKEGQLVDGGKSIGKMGMTGMATGPHLHWGLSIQNVRVDPMYWVENESLI